MPTRSIALVDLDGTLVDFDGGMREKLAQLRSPAEDPAFDERAYEDVPHLRARRRMIKSVPGFWRNLEPIPRGFEIVGALRRFEFELHVLSKGPLATPIAWQEKVEWCLQHLPDVPVTVCSDKSLVYGRILVDDWPDYFTRWLQHRPRGLVIVPAQPWNADYTSASHPQIVRYEDDPAEMLQRLEQLAARSSE